MSTENLTGLLIAAAVVALIAVLEVWDRRNHKED